MTLSLLLLIGMVVMYAAGIALMLDRSLTRIVVGFIMVGNATNLLIFLMSGDFGEPPFVGAATPEEMSDPLPQAFILTSIVISFAITAFLLALIYRSYRLDRADADEVFDDDADVALSQTETLTIEEVMDEELEEHSDFALPEQVEHRERERERELKAAQHEADLAEQEEQR